MACVLCLLQFALLRPLGGLGQIATPVLWLSLLNATLYASDMWVSIAHSQGLQFMIEPDMATMRMTRPVTTAKAVKPNTIVMVMTAR